MTREAMHAKKKTMKRILIIDDDPVLRDVLGQTLRQAEYRVTTAADGKQASLLYRSDPPDIVITDIYMPDKDGLETLMELRRDHPEVKVIAISGGVSNAHMLDVATALGASATLVKPFLPAELIEAVEKVARS